MLKMLPNGAQQAIITYQDLSEAQPVRFDHVPFNGMTGVGMTSWKYDGVYLAPWKMPEDIMQRYEALRSKLGPGGWAYATPYLHYRELRDLCLYEKLRETAAGLVGEEVLLHLNLTGWVSTERDLHSDSYLNPPGVNDWYIAAWIALEDVHPDSGPFQYLPGSHRWPVLSSEKIFQVAPELRGVTTWPADTQNLVARACFEEALARGVQLKSHLPKRGEVLFWHSNLVHRGGRPKVRGTQRKACIAHYSGVNHRPDMTWTRDALTGGAFAEFTVRGWDKAYPEPTV